MFSNRVGIVVMMQMARMAMRSMICLRSATTTSPTGKWEQLLRSAAAQSRSTGHRQAEVRNEYKTNHNFVQTPSDSQTRVSVSTKVRKTGFLASRHLLSVGGGKEKL